jgi:hypothetical protein
MEIHSLKLSVTEQELNQLAAQAPSGKSTVENLSVHLTPEGIIVSGDYPIMFMKVGFETLWEVTGAGSIVEARLASIKVSGLPAGKLRGVLIKTLRDLLASEPGVRVTDEAIHVDLSKHTALQRLNLRIFLTGVYCMPGELVIEAGPALA